MFNFDGSENSPHEEPSYRPIGHIIPPLQQPSPVQRKKRTKYVESQVRATAAYWVLLAELETVWTHSPTSPNFYWG